MFRQHRGRLVFKNKRNMITKQVKIAGKDVTLAYCIGTEIAFHGMAGIEFKDFVQEAAVKKTSDPRYVIHAILAAAITYAQSKGIDEPITDKDLMFEATNEELTEALVEITKMFAEWYKLPLGEEQKAKKGSKGKN